MTICPARVPVRVEFCPEASSAMAKITLAAPTPTGETLPLAAARLLPPVRPRLFIGLWNNFHAVATAQGYEREQAKEWRVLQTMEEFAPSFYTHVIYATDALLKKSPDATCRFVKGWFQTIDWMRSNKDKTVSITSKVLNVDPAIISRTYDNEIHIFTKDGSFEPGPMAALKKSFIDMKILDAEPKDSDMVDARCVPYKS